MDLRTYGRTKGRLCLWVDEDADVVTISMDAWDANYDLQTVLVRPVGPFDEWPVLVDWMRKALTSQPPLF